MRWLVVVITAALAIYFYLEAERVEERCEKLLSSCFKTEDCCEEFEEVRKELESVRRERDELASKVAMLEGLLASRPEKWTVKLEGGGEDKLEKMVSVARGSLNSKILADFADIVEVSNAVYLAGEVFSFYYVNDSDLFGEEDAVVNPEWFLVHRVGDCDDVAVAMAALLKLKGYDVELCVGKRAEGWHAYVRLWGEDVDYQYCLNGLCRIDVGNFGNEGICESV
ncbi:MAG: transglutaminase domain-containing protein [Archaeoglobaceae archaeon]